MSVDPKNLEAILVAVDEINLECARAGLGSLDVPKAPKGSAQGEVFVRAVDRNEVVEQFLKKKLTKQKYAWYEDSVFRTVLDSDDSRDKVRDQFLTSASPKLGDQLEESLYPTPEAKKLAPKLRLPLPLVCLDQSIKPQFEPEGKARAARHFRPVSADPRYRSAARNESHLNKPPEGWFFADEWAPFTVAQMFLRRSQKDLGDRWIEHHIQEWFRNRAESWDDRNESDEALRLRRKLWAGAYKSLSRKLPLICEELNALSFDSRNPTHGEMQNAGTRYYREEFLVDFLADMLAADIGDDESDDRSDDQSDVEPENSDPSPEPPADGWSAERAVAKNFLSFLIWIRCALTGRVAQQDVLALGKAARRKGPDPSSFPSVLCFNRHLDPVYIRNRMNAAIPGIPGFSFIFRGGLLPEPDMGRATVIRGVPGAGKTSFALALMADMAARGRLSVYASLEQPYAWLKRRLDKMGCLHRSAFRLVRLQDLPRIPDPAGKGILAIADRDYLNVDPDADLIDMVDDVAAILEEHTHRITASDEPVSSGLARRLDWKAIAIDSVNRFRFGVPDDTVVTAEEWYRVQLFRLVDQIERRNLWGLLLAEKADDMRFRTLDYEANTVMELERDDTYNRTIEITKSRTQAVRSGPHAFTLSADWGVRIFPNNAAMEADLGTFRRPSPSDQWCLDTSWLQQFRSDAEPAPLPVIPVKSSILVAAVQPQSALPVGLTLALCPRQRIEDSIPRRNPAEVKPNFVNDGKEDPRNVVLVSFRAPTARMARWLNDRSVANRPEIEFEVWRRWFPPDRLISSAAVLDEIRGWFQTARERGMPIDRILFDGIDLLPEFLPAVAADPEFLPTLHELVLTRSVTAIFLASRPVPSIDRGYPDTRYESLWDLVDYAFIRGGGEKDKGGGLTEKKSPDWEVK